MRLFFKDSLSFFFLFGIIFIPLHLMLMPWQSDLADWLFGTLIQCTAENIFGVVLSNPSISSDSASLYILMTLLAVIAFLIVLALNFLKKWENTRSQLLLIFRSIFILYLSFRLLEYGFDKILKVQFYLPEPNILYTPVGQLSKDILYWSTIGSSYLYNVATGGVECLAALLLLFRKTRTIGLLLAAASLFHVVLINFSFDISVKLLSVFLFLLSMYLLAPHARNLYRALTHSRQPIVLFGKKDKLAMPLPLRVFLRMLIIGAIFTEVLYPPLSRGSLNDDLAPRPYLHGAYQVLSSTSQNDSLRIEIPLKRVFIHRSGYLIFQDEHDHFTDYRLKVDSANSKFHLTDYNLNTTMLHFEYQTRDSILTFRYPFTPENKCVLLKAKALDWHALPLLQNDFHWTVDGI